jgi:hypothetical protein
MLIGNAMDISIKADKPELKTKHPDYFTKWGLLWMLNCFQPWNSVLCRMLLSLLLFPASFNPFRWTPGGFWLSRVNQS